MFEQQKTISLYKEDSRGNLREYVINKDYANHSFDITYGTIGGKRQHKTIAVTTNQSKRTIEEQIDLEASSRLQKKMDEGYKRTKEEARSGKGTNAIGNVRPMLAKKFEPEKHDVSDGVFVQRKYDGHRCLIHKEGRNVQAFSRKGRPITTIDHILETIVTVPYDFILDGELYIHNTPLQKITSAAKKTNELTPYLQFICYDVVDTEAPYYQRRELIEDFVTVIDHPRVVAAPTAAVDHFNNVQILFAQYRKEGYEGAIVRYPDAPYEVGKRSKHLLKVKKQDDTEVTVIGCQESVDGWAVLQCRTDRGVEFTVTAPGTREEKKEILHNFDDYRGRRLTIEYAHWTEDHAPFHPVAIRFREDL